MAELSAASSWLSRDSPQALVEAAISHAAPTQSADELLHELRMQNENLGEALQAAEIARQRYCELYEFAPNAYLTLTDTGLVAELNRASVALLGYERGDLLHRPFDRFIAAADHDRWHMLFQQALQRPERQTCEVTMQGGDGRQLDVRLDCKRLTTVGETPRLYLAVIDISESKRVREELLTREPDRDKLVRHIVDFEERERRRLALEVHDVVSPNLATLLVNLSLIERELPQPLPSHIERRFAELKQSLRATDQSLRNISAALRPSSLDYVGLYAAVEDYARQFAERTGIIVTMLDGKAQERLPAEVETLLFRIVQEALTNCAKYARASRITLGLRHSREHARLEIVDDGIGFDPEKRFAAGARHGLGLLTMAERATLAGGRFSLASRPGQGTTITVEV